MVTARSINYPGRRAFSRDLKLKARSPGACLFSASSCSQRLGIAESLLGILKRQYEQQGDNMPSGQLQAVWRDCRTASPVPKPSWSAMY